MNKEDIKRNQQARQATRKLLKKALRSSYVEARLCIYDQIALDSEASDYAKEHVDEIVDYLWGYVSGTI